MNLKQVFEKVVDLQSPDKVNTAAEAEQIQVFALNKKGRIFNVKDMSLTVEDDGSKSFWIDVEEAN